MGVLWTWMAAGAPWLATGAFGMGVASALVPWLNAEILMLSVLPLAPTPSAVWAVVAAITGGQMAGKCAVYGVGRRSGRLGSDRTAAALDRWQHRLERHPKTAAFMVFASALIGFPPFFLVSMAAGAAGMALVRFAVVGTCGRLLHFGAVAWLPQMVGRFV